MDELLESFVLYTLLLLFAVYIFSYFYRIDVEGFASPGTIQPRIQAELAAVRAGTTGVSASPTFFTQTTTMPILPQNQSFLVNICPLTGYLGGYLGPPEQIFDATIYLQNAFRAGIRSFILPISTYLSSSKEPPTWPNSKDPALVCRDTSDIIISKNGITLDVFIEALIANRSVAGQGLNTDPIMLYIEDHISDLDRSKINYVTFMKKIVTALKPLDPYRLTTYGSLGSCVGGTKQQQQMLLTQIPLGAFSNKIIIFTNFDTVQDEENSLASYANFIYGDDLPTRTVGLEDLIGTTENYVSNSRINWYIATSKTPLVAPSIATVENALANGIQCIPIPFLSVPMSTVTDIWNLWKNSSAKLKAEKARYTQPAPVVPSKVSTKLSASIQGQPPGNLVVS